MAQKYEVSVRCISYLFAEVEAESFDEAYEIAENMDGGDFEEDISSCVWDISSITDEAGETEWYL